MRQERKERYEYLYYIRAGFLMAVASEAAYRDEKDVIDRLNAMGINDAKFINHKNKKFNIDTQAFVASTDFGTLISFRGTASLRDWATDLTASKTSYHGGAAHSGFLAAWNDVKPAIEEYLSSVPSPSGAKKEVWVGGHSLGGSIALLCGLDLDAQGYDVKGIYTYGQPMVFGKEATATLGKTNPNLISHIFRYIFADDPVPSLPSPAIGYDHIGNVYLSKEFGEVFEQNRDGIYWPKLGDHSITNYIKTLAAIMNSSKDPSTRKMAQWIINQDFPLAPVIGPDWEFVLRHFKG